MCIYYLFESVDFYLLSMRLPSWKHLGQKKKKKLNSASDRFRTLNVILFDQKFE